MTQTPRQMRARERQPDKPVRRVQKDAPRRAPSRVKSRAPRRGVSGAALFASMVIVFIAGAVAAPFAQYFLGPRLAEVSGLADLAAGASPDAARLRALEVQAAALTERTDTLSRDSGGSARVNALETELDLLRDEIETLADLANRSPALTDNAEALAALETRLATLEATPPAPDVSGDVTALGGRLANVDTALAEVRAESARLAAAVDALQARLAEDLRSATALVQERLSALEASRGDSGLGDTVARLETRTGALEAALDRTSGRTALVASLGNLRAAAERGRPYEAELHAVRTIAVSLEAPQLDDPLDRLAVTAGTGLPSLIALQRGFAAMANRAAQGSTAPGESWMGRTLDRVSSIVTVRRTGEIAGNTPEAIVARAEIHVTAGELAAAVEEMTRLEGQSGDVDDWLRRARLRLGAERALDELSAQVLAIGGAG